ncbi:Diphthine methyltransferase-like [Porphyridium purpureum]|uniref:methylated diphthine methylhydrolase n=1 Tax=Porphyridium purpureum TaxID=35688 RepID=A0A5J4YZI0_PORPP|nr:Diphthine methyltransferase-like [Porphyridium purpureum]|eukprot:POR8027..scf208_2
MQATLRAQFRTQFGADAVETRQNLVACTTYSLDENDGSSSSSTCGSSNRRGCVHVLDVGAADDKLVLLASSEETAGLLDVRWLQSEVPQFACAGSDGAVHIFQVCDNRVQTLNRHLRAEGDGLALSIDVEDTLATPRLCVSYSDGAASAYQLTPAAELQPIWSRVSCHELETWVAAFDASRPNVMYSGGDDGRLLGWDLRQPPGVSASDAIFRVNRAHSMVGVTTVSSHAAFPHMIISGGYDDCMKVWDVRSSRAELSDLNLGGGVWRIKHHPERPWVMLAACMYDGVKVVTLNRESGDALNCVLEYKRHESIAYGVSWINSSEDKSHRLNLNADILSASFYDRALHRWSVE